MIENMKRKFLLVSLLLGMLFFTSCDKVKNAFSETFGNEKNRQKELSDAFNNPGSLSSSSGKQREKTLEEALKEFRAIVDESGSEFDKKQMEAVEQMVKKDMEKWNNTEISLLFQPDKLERIQKELYQFLKTDEVMIYSGAIFVEDDRVRVVAINPQNKNEADWYWYETKTGKWRKEDPKKLSKSDMENIDKKIYPFSSIKLRTAHKVYTEGLKRLADIEGAELPSGTTFYYFPHKQSWSMSLSGARADYSLEADIDGNVIKFEMR